MRRLSLLDRLRLAAFELGLARAPVWMLAALYQATRARRPPPLDAAPHRG